MGDSGAIRAGRAFVEIFSDDVQLKKGLKQAERMFSNTGKVFQRVGRSMLASGLALASPLALATKMFASMGNELAKMSTRTGVSVENLSKLQYAADESGTSLEGLEGGLKKMTKNLADAANGGKETGQTFADLGLSAEQLVNVGADEQLAAIADALDKIQNPTERAAAALKVFGKSGTDLLPMLDGGAAGLRELYGHAEKLGLVMSTEDAKAAEEFTNRMNDLWKVVKSVGFTIGGTLAPVVRAVALALTDGAKATKEFLTEHRDIVLVAGLAAAGLIAVGVAAIALGAGLSFIGAVIGAVVTAFGAVAAVVSFAISPFGLLVAGIAAAGYALLKFTNIGTAVGNFLSGVFNDLKADALEAFGGIRDALEAGDFSLAANILWTALKVEWAKGTLALQNLWSEFKDATLNIFADLSAEVQTAWSYMTEYLSNWDGVKSAAEKFFRWFEDRAKIVTDKIARMMNAMNGDTMGDSREVDQKRIAEMQKKGLSPALAAKVKKSGSDTYLTYDADSQKKQDDLEYDESGPERKRIDAEYARTHGASAAAAKRQAIEAERKKAHAGNDATLRGSVDSNMMDYGQQLADLKDRQRDQLAKAHEEALLSVKNDHKKKSADFEDSITHTAKSTGTFNGQLAGEIFGTDKGADRIVKAIDTLGKRIESRWRNGPDMNMHWDNNYQ